ncbi:AAA family ATPase [Chitinophaga sedimenti]|uniref:AAA family ATPase n=1 Tax=Chitinophaga sedimenti TaxID=2033606 RepID=UPI0020058FF7|nr:AAA family ATPase [Chitinophaga sedimenti]MCK7559474.1 AAA family ATPase [Chitinophaga sedimenti]
MEKEFILDVARSEWRNVEMVHQNIYKGNWMSVGQNRAAICYLDLDGEEVFDNFKGYQERLLSGEFYNNPGGIQWNFYLFVIRDSFEGKDKKLIENDEIYARKYLLEPKEFKNFFRLEKGSDTPAPNVLANWKAELEQAGLIETYQDTTITSATKRFIEGNPVPSIQKRDATTTNNVVRLQKIDRLILNASYRQYPNVRQYQFGAMNLITGVNGVGKTSILEAIELSICGKIFRDSSVEFPTNSLTMYANGSNSPFPFSPSNLGLYRDRDRQWYGNSTMRTSELFLSFNRFNYYNADAARDFTEGNTEQGIQEAVSNIVLGADFSRIIDRVDKFLLALRPALNSLTTQLQKQRDVKEKSQAKVAAFQSTGDVKLLAERITQELSELRPVHADKISIDSLGSVDLLINELEIRLEPFERSSHVIDSITSHTHETTKLRDEKKSI